jgi:hypothetical protein
MIHILTLLCTNFYSNLSFGLGFLPVNPTCATPYFLGIPIHILINELEIQLR